MKKLFVVSIIAILLIPVVLGFSGRTSRYYVFSTNPALKAMLGVKHEFPEAFSTELTEGQAKALKLLGIKTERVKLYHIVGYTVSAKPVCGDGVLHPSEDCEAPDYSCPEGYTCVDCKCVAEEEEERTCYPDNQKP
jgi:hypothetical protein